MDPRSPAARRPRLASPARRASQSFTCSTNLLSCARHEHTRQIAAHQRVEDRTVAGPVPGGSLGQGLLLDQRCGSCGRPAQHGRRARDRSLRRGAGVEGPRPTHAGGHSLLRHSGASPAPPGGGVRHCHFGERLQESLRGGVSDQGQSAAAGGRRGVPLRQGIRLRARGRLQAGAARGDVHHRECARAHRGVQRLQGRYLHRGGHSRHQARPHHHSRWWRTTKRFI